MTRAKTAGSIKTLKVKNRSAWKTWLRKHHASTSEIWLIFHKRHTGIKGLEYNDEVLEALSVGWVDSLVRRIDENLYARKFTPRKAGSRWSTVNRKRYADLQSRGVLAAGKEPGLK